LKYGLVVFGDYEPFSAVTVDRKYFTSDPALFLEIFKNITCENGGMVKNAIEEGMVAALEVRNKQKNKPSIIQH
jgi:hypothetical protein